MDLILDTNAVSALAAGDSEIATTLAAFTAPALPSIVMGEYRFGVLKSRYRAQHEEWIAAELSVFALLVVDGETAVHYATVRLELERAGTPIPMNDLWIAALARQHGLPVLSRDRHFDRVPGLRRIGW